MKSSKKIKREEFIRICKLHGLKITPQRMAIYEEVTGSSGHPSAEIIYRKIKRKYPGISFDTVNRTLLTFSDIGLLQIVEGYGEPKRFDANTQDHHHFRCLRCGSIIDVYHKRYDELEIPAEIETHHKVIRKRVVLEGICKQCRER